MCWRICFVRANHFSAKTIGFFHQSVDKNTERRTRTNSCLKVATAICFQSGVKHLWHWQNNNKFQTKLKTLCAVLIPTSAMLGVVIVLFVHRMHIFRCASKKLAEQFRSTSPIHVQWTLQWRQGGLKWCCIQSHVLLVRSFAYPVLKMIQCLHPKWC